MPIPQDYKHIVEILYSASNEGRVKWSKSRFGYEVVIQSSRFQVWNGTDEESNQDFIAFALTDEKGKTLDSWYVDESESEYQFMHNFLSSAKRQALGISKIISKLKDVIDRGGVIGEEKLDQDDLPF